MVITDYSVVRETEYVLDTGFTLSAERLFTKEVKEDIKKISEDILGFEITKLYVTKTGKLKITWPYNVPNETYAFGDFVSSLKEYVNKLG